MKHAHTAGHTPEDWRVVDSGNRERPAIVVAEYLQVHVDHREDFGNPAPDAALIALAPTAPHDCDMPGCPGAENKRRLESWERMLIEHEENKRKLEAAEELVEALKRATLALEAWDTQPESERRQAIAGARVVLAKAQDAKVWK